MIKKSLLTALVLLVGYSVFVALSPRVSTQAQHFYYNNLALAQRYLYQANKTSHAVIVGSSLASKIRVDSLAGFYNLALVGQGAHDGLRIVALAPVLPTDVYLETNMILVLPNSTFFSQNFSFLPRKLGEFWTVLHADKRPLAIAADYADRERRNYFPTKKNNLKNKGNVRAEKLEVRRKSMLAPPDSALLHRQLELLAEEIDFLKKKGVKFHFFEMPIDTSLQQLPQAVAVRRALAERFPHEMARLLTAPEAYRTTDGVHLTEAEFMRFTAFFKQNLGKF